MYYGDVESGDEYFASRLGGQAWKDAEDADKELALQNATDLIETFNFVGYKADSDQELEFPRYGQTDVPAAVLQACYLIANEFLDGKTVDGQLEASRVIRRKVVEFETHYKNNMVPHQVAGMVSLVAWRLLLPYIRDAGTVRIERV